jgi:hypothetical protein
METAVASPVSGLWQNQGAVRVLGWLKSAGLVTQPQEQAWLGMVKAFDREWGPIAGALVPLECLGNGQYICVPTVPPMAHEDGTPGPVFLWDATADLGEQFPEPLYETAEEYFDERAWGLDVLAETEKDRASDRARAAEDLLERVQQFQARAGEFHKAHRRFDHDRESSLPGFDTWRPIRFCVEDHLLGVLGYRYDAYENSINVDGFATRDHTNYARGSATKGLLTILLCEWAQQGGSSQIQFRYGIPREVRLFAALHGVPVVRETDALSSDAARSLAAKLAGVPEAGGLPVHQAALLIERQLWAKWQIDDLLQWCPLALDVLTGDVTPGEQVRMSLARDHAAVVMLADSFHRAVLAQSEAKGGALSREAAGGFPYAARYWCDRDLLPLEGGKFVLPAGRPVTVAFLVDPDSSAIPPDWVLITPRGAIHGRDARSVTYAMDLDRAGLYEAAMRRFKEARRLRLS